MRFAKGSTGALAVTMVFTSVSARAQAPGSDKVTAEALFEDARKLAADKKYAEACPKFADSERLDPSASTLLNLASCWEKLGHTATAWATYKQAASAADAAGRKDYVTAAERHADALAPTLARLTISVVGPVDGIQIRRDGVNVDRAEWGAAIPIDPGSHALEASAPGHKEWSSSVDIPQNGAQVAATVPPLEAAPLGATTVAPAGAAGGAPASVAVATTPEPPATPATTGASTQRIAGWVVSGLGVVGVAISAGYAVAAKSKYNDSLPNCLSGDHNECNAAGISERSDARSAGDAATVAFVLGGVAIAGGIVLWLTAAPGGAKTQESARGPSLGLMPTLGGAALKGAW